MEEFTSYIEGDESAGIEDYVREGAEKWKLVVVSLTTKKLPKQGGLLAFLEPQAERVDFTLKGTEENIRYFKRQVRADMARYNA